MNSSKEMSKKKKNQILIQILYNNYKKLIKNYYYFIYIYIYIFF